MKVLEATLEGGKGKRLTEFSRELEIPKSTLVPILQSLCDMGYLFGDESGRYQAGTALFSLGAAFSGCFPILDYVKGKLEGLVAVCTGGTADIPVAEEAAKTAEFFGCRVERYYDIGVAGIHRLLSKREAIARANCVIAVAGMEGALGTVVAGLVENPVIAVPTSVGYGASFHGLSALITMINSCANGISVVNIDNGYGAAYLAAQINRLAVREPKKTAE